MGRSRRSGARHTAGHSPDGVPDIIGDEERGRPIERYADRTPVRVAVVIEESREHVNRGPGCPPAKGTNTTLYPLRGRRFHEPCCPMNMPPVNCAGNVRFSRSEYASPSEAV